MYIIPQAQAWVTMTYIKQRAPPTHPMLKFGVRGLWETRFDSACFFDKLACSAVTHSAQLPPLTHERNEGWSDWIDEKHGPARHQATLFVQYPYYMRCNSPNQFWAEHHIWATMVIGVYTLKGPYKQPW